MNSQPTPLTLSPITMQRLSTISLMQKLSVEQIIDKLVEEHFSQLIPQLEEYMKTIPIDPARSGKRSSNRETDVYMVPNLDPPEQ
ncbi:hypothetical protein KKF84_11730 [Myxococcota bacterium]|nr:hypothetical protein [Myxococcota bacterium]MBU1535983.1 hypothetical protein [Myxococcota bacterium]